MDVEVFFEVVIESHGHGVVVVALDADSAAVGVKNKDIGRVGTVDEVDVTRLVAQNTLGKLCGGALATQRGMNEEHDGQDEGYFFHVTMDWTREIMMMNDGG